jgi:hypothetical protein
MKVKEIIRLGEKYSIQYNKFFLILLESSFVEEEINKLIANIPLPFVMKDIKQRGKEVAILTNNPLCILFTSLGQGDFILILQLNILGSYMYPLKNYEDLLKEPFKADGYLAFKGTLNDHEAVLVMVRYS